ncbi:MAG: hypothetical protein ACLU8F_00645 [Clostridia bacterium]
MMFSYPYFGFPMGRRYPYPYGYSIRNPIKNTSNVSTLKSKATSKVENDAVEVSPLSSQSRSKEENRGEFFEIFGIKLYFDDILLICLIFFLYQEGVEDTGLFISLILLLLS